MPSLHEVTVVRKVGSSDWMMEETPNPWRLGVGSVPPEPCGLRVCVP